MESPKANIELQVRANGAGPNHDSIASKSQAVALSDDQQLRRLGKKPVLKRSFGFMSILGFSCTVLISWEGILVTSVQGLLNGGPAGIVWGFLIDWLGTLATFASIAELASMAPTAGGQCMLRLALIMLLDSIG